MRKGVLFLFFAVLFSFNMLVAHPPKAIDLSFDLGTHILTATILHSVDNPTTHFIEKIVVSSNNKEIITHILSRQYSENTQEAMYLITDIAEGDTIAVTAYCSISGKKTATIEAVHQKKPPIEGKQ